MKDKTIKDKVFLVKIADLLHETGKEDQVIFEKKFSDQLPNLSELGIAGTFTIQSLDATSLLGTLTDITASFHETCDSCGSEFLRKVSIPSYVARFAFEEDVTEAEKNQSDESIFFIDPKSETINIEDMVVQAILLHDPFVKRCEPCTKRLDEEGDEDDNDYFESKGNITFS